MEVQHPCFAQVDNEVNFNDTAREKQIEEMLWKRRSIYKLPASVTDLNKKAYRPQVISFGPYHRNDEMLRPMEEHKDRLLRRFLRRSSKTLQFYLELLKKEKDFLMDAYYPRWSDDENVFLRIMVRDGCCMLEIFQSCVDDYASNDPIFGHHGRNHFQPYIQLDMLKLENQLPMRVLEMLLGQDVEAVNELVCKFFYRMSAPPLGQCEHLLDLHRKMMLQEFSTVSTDSISSDPSTVEMEMQVVIPDSFLPDPFPGAFQIKMISDSISPHSPIVEKEIQSKKRQARIFLGRPNSNRPNPSNSVEKEMHRGEDQDDIEVIRPATELDEAGIRIRKSTPGNLKNIKFDSKTGTLGVPPISVDDSTEPIFLNIMAFERFHVGAENWVTAYVFFMDSIINDAKDIGILHKFHVVKNAVGSDDAAAQLFNSLSKEVALGTHGSLKQVIKDVNNYCKKWRPRWQSYFFRTYWSNTWILVSVIAATVIFILTVIQTVYTMMSYKY